MALAPRLQSLLDRCLPDLALWDLCCDHGHLGLAALKSGRFSEVIFNDKLAHRLFDLQAKLPPGAPARLVGGPAQDINESLEGNIVVAGIGGERIAHILQALQSERLRAARLILCPEKDPELLTVQFLTNYKLVEAERIPHRQSNRKLRQRVTGPPANNGWRALFVYDRREPDLRIRR